MARLTAPGKSPPSSCWSMKPPMASSWPSLKRDTVLNGYVGKKSNHACHISCVIVEICARDSVVRSIPGFRYTVFQAG